MQTQSFLTHTHTFPLCCGRDSQISWSAVGRIRGWGGGAVGWGGCRLDSRNWSNLVLFFFLFNAIYILQITMTLDIPSSLCFSLPVSTLLVECLYFVFFPVLYPVISSNKTAGDRLVSYFRRLFFSHSCAVLVVPWPKPSGFSPQDGWLAWPVAPDGLLNRTRTVTDCLDGDWMNLLSLTD